VSTEIFAEQEIKVNYSDKSSAEINSGLNYDNMIPQDLKENRQLEERRGSFKNLKIAIKHVLNEGPPGESISDDYHSKDESEGAKNGKKDSYEEEKFIIRKKRKEKSVKFANENYSEDESNRQSNSSGKDYSDSNGKKFTFSNERNILKKSYSISGDNIQPRKLSCFVKDKQRANDSPTDTNEKNFTTERTKERDLTIEMPPIQTNHVSPKSMQQNESTNINLIVTNSPAFDPTPSNPLGQREDLKFENFFSSTSEYSLDFSGRNGSMNSRKNTFLSARDDHANMNPVSLTNIPDLEPNQLAVNHLNEPNKESRGEMDIEGSENLTHGGGEVLYVGKNEGIKNISEKVQVTNVSSMEKILFVEGEAMENISSIEKGDLSGKFLPMKLDENKKLEARDNILITSEKQKLMAGQNRNTEEGTLKRSLSFRHNKTLMDSELKAIYLKPDGESNPIRKDEKRASVSGSYLTDQINRIKNAEKSMEKSPKDDRISGRKSIMLNPRIQSSNLLEVPTLNINSEIDGGGSLQIKKAVQSYKEVRSLSSDSVDGNRSSEVDKTNTEYGDTDKESVDLAVIAERSRKYSNLSINTNSILNDAKKNKLRGGNLALKRFETLDLEHKEKKKHEMMLNRNISSFESESSSVMSGVGSRTEERAENQTRKK
jgi:hypothetical protein